MKSRLFCLLLVLSTPAFAAISQVQSEANWTGGTASCAVAPTSSTTRNNLVVFWTTWTSTSTLTATASDGTTNNSYVSAVGPTLQTATSTPTSAQLFYAVIRTGTTNTITVTFTGGSASTSGCQLP